MSFDWNLTFDLFISLEYVSGSQRVAHLPLSVFVSKLSSNYMFTFSIYIYIYVCSYILEMLAHMLLCFVMNGHIEGLLLEAHVKRRENPQMFSSSTKFWRWSRFRMTCACVNIPTFLFLKEE